MDLKKAELTPPELHEVIPPKELKKYTGDLKRSALAELIKNGEFPAPVRLTERRKAWLKSELVAWQQERIARRDDHEHRGQEPNDGRRPGHDQEHGDGRRRGATSATGTSPTHSKG